MKFIFFLSLFISSSAWSSTTITGQVKKPNHHILLRQKADVIEFRPNSSLHWGTKISGERFYFEYGQKLKNTNYSGSSVGNDSYKDYRLGISIKNTFTEIIYKEWIGFSSNEEETREGSDCEFCVERAQLSSRERNLTFLFAFDSSFSMKSLNSNGSEGVSFQTSWLGSFFTNRLKIFDPSGIVQESDSASFSLFTGATSFEMRQIGFAGGFGVLAPLGPMYFGLAGLLGAGLQENKRVTINNELYEKIGVGARVSVKAMIATHGSGMNYGIKAFFFSNIYEVAGNESIASVNYSIYVYSSYTW